MYKVKVDRLFRPENLRGLNKNSKANINLKTLMFRISDSWLSRSIYFVKHLLKRAIGLAS